VYGFVCQGWTQLHAINFPNFPPENSPQLSLGMKQGVLHIRIGARSAFSVE
jgi:hypothetical protein